MTTDLDRLPPDQRAVLSLVLERGKSYSEVADMLAIPESAVRDRAHAALDALGTTGLEATRTAASGGQTGARRAGARAQAGASSARTRGTRPTTQRSSLTAPSSRMGGALLLGAIVVVVVIAVILLTSGGKSSKTNTNASTTTTSTSASSSKPALDATITMSAAEPGINATGKTYVLSRGSQRAFYIAAQGLPPSSGFFYAVWLYNSPSSSTPLGRAPTVGSNGRMEGGGPLPTNASSFHQLIVTRETSSHPSQPGPMVMTGTFKIH